MLTTSSIHFDWREYVIPEDSQVPIGVLCDILKDAIPSATQTQLEEMLSALDRRWTDDKNSRLPKRLGKLVKKTLSVSLPSQFFGSLHKLQEEYGPKTFKLRWKDIVKEGFWREGKYGDANSCYWGDRSAAKEVLQAEGAFAIQYEHQEDLGRCWAYNHYRGLVLFNHYGPLTLRTLASVIADNRKQKFERIALENDGSTDGLIYINSGIGYLIADNPETHSIDLQWDTSEHESRYRCYNCGCSVDEDEIYVGHDNCYCDCCFSELFTYCRCCDEAIDRDDAIEVDGESYCEYCVTNDHTQCGCCDSWVPNDEIYDDIDQKPICDECSSGIPQCEECSCVCCDSDRNEQYHTCNGDTYCFECADLETTDELETPPPSHYFDLDAINWKLTRQDVQRICGRIGNYSAESYHYEQSTIIMHGIEGGEPFPVDSLVSDNGLWAFHLDAQESRPMFRVVHRPSNLAIGKAIQTVSQACACVTILEHYCNVNQWLDIDGSHDLSGDALYAGRRLKEYLKLI